MNPAVSTQRASAGYGRRGPGCANTPSRESASRTTLTGHVSAVPLPVHTGGSAYTGIRFFGGTTLRMLPPPSRKGCGTATVDQMPALPRDHLLFKGREPRTRVPRAPGTRSMKTRKALPLAPWVGGKAYLCREIIPRIDAIPHDLYAEPFIGMAGVFLRRSRPARIEAINDLADDVVTLFRVAKFHPQALADELRLAIVARSEFRTLLDVDPATLTDIQRVARFIRLQRMRYSGKPDSRSFPIRGTVAKSFDATDLRQAIEALHDRLARVCIEQLDWREFVTRYDRPGALFYLDPPYFGCEHYYGRGLFDRAQFAEMAEILGNLKGRFLLSLNDRPEVRALFRNFDIHPFTCRYSVANGNGVGRELIIGN